LGKKVELLRAARLHRYADHWVISTELAPNPAMPGGARRRLQATAPLQLWALGALSVPGCPV
jgi:hypothetical protein